MIKDENVEIWATLELVDDVKRLGLSYRFEKEIREALDRFLSLERCGGIIIHRSLHETALSFRLLREYGYDVSADVFERFKDCNGNFKACLVTDAKGMLSLYEASFFSYEGEHILDEAMAFTSFHLRGLHEGRSSILLEQVNHALELPLHRRVQRLEARWYIELCDKRKDANRVLLEAAKLDFNLVQSALQQDLKEMSSRIAPLLPGSQTIFVSCSTETEEKTIVQKRKRARRVSFAENEITSVHIFRRDDDQSSSSSDSNDDDSGGKAVDGS